MFIQQGHPAVRALPAKQHRIPDLERSLRQVDSLTKPPDGTEPSTLFSAAMTAILAVAGSSPGRTPSRVPVENWLGAEGEGFSHLTQELVRERLGAAVGAYANASAAIEFANAYLQQRHVYGRPVAKFREHEVRSSRMLDGSHGHPGNGGSLAGPRRDPRIHRRCPRIKLFCTERPAGSSTSAYNCTGATATCASTQLHACTPTPAFTLAPARSSKLPSTWAFDPKGPAPPRSGVDPGSWIA